MKLILNFGGSKFTYIRLEIPLGQHVNRFYDRFLAVPIELRAIRRLREREQSILTELKAHSSAEIRKRERALRELQMLQKRIEQLG